MLKYFFISLLVFISGIVSAQVEYNVLEPIPGITDSGTFTATDFPDFLKKVFNFGIGIVALLAVIMVVIGGIEYMGSEGPFNKSSAKDKIQNAIMGLLLALGIVLFLNTINPNLINLNLDLGRTGSAPGGAGSGGVSTEPEGGLANILETENRIRNQLESGRVYINKNPCQRVGQTNCTNVGSLPPNAIGGLIRLAQVCRTEVWVSGGTEWWLHGSHGPNIPVVDISKTRDVNQELYNCLKERFGVTGATIPLRENFSDSVINAVFYNEDAIHFHVTFR